MASRPLLVPKPGSKVKLRMAVDLRPVNAATIKESWPMPHLESEILDFANSTCFAILDFVSAYWQLPLHPDSYTACGVVTPRGVVASKRVLPGLANATAYFQSSVEPLFSELRENMKAWLDDFNLFCGNEEHLLLLLERFFVICCQHGLLLSAKKSVLFARELRWCGRIIDARGYKMDPSNVEGLHNMDLPRNAAELAQFVYCCRWMAISIPNFSVTVAPLVDVLEEAYSKAGRRTSRSIKKFSLDKLSWGQSHEDAFRTMQNSLQSAVKLAYPDHGKVLCVFTDASDRFWSGVVTQVSEDQLALPFEQQSHEPLAFLGAAFKKSELNWTTFEKEAFAIFKTFEKLDYLFAGRSDIRVFTDHRNLLFVFAPRALEPTLGRHVVSKVQRWAFYLSRFDYIIEHIRGEENVFADILTRWTKGYRQREDRKAVCSVLLQEAEQLAPNAGSIIWPDIAEFRRAQDTSPQKALTLGLVRAEDQLWKERGRIWVPSSDLELQLRVLVVSHCGTIGHRGKDATLSILLESFWWPDISEDVNGFVKGCLHCLLTRTGDMVPRPLAHALHGTKPNEVIHADFLYMGPGQGDKKYTLIIRDDLSGYVWLWPSDVANAETAGEAFCQWIGVFGTFEWLVTDQGSHFKNSLIRGLTEETRVGHHFTTAYSPWANGSVERVCREVLRSCRALLSEWKMGPREWPAILEAIQAVLNHAPLRRLGLRDATTPGVYRTPQEVFTGHKPRRPLLRALPLSKYPTQKTNDETRTRQVLEVERLQMAMDDMHRKVAETNGIARERAVKRHNMRTNVRATNFIEGDFVLVRTKGSTGHKLQFKWRGPRRITNVVSDLVYEVENLITKKRETVHARRLQFYRSDFDGKEVSLSLTSATEHLETHYQTAHALQNIRQNSSTGRLEVAVECAGLPDSDDYTWEPVEQINEDLPGMFHDYLHTSGKRALKRQALAQFNLE